MQRLADRLFEIDDEIVQLHRHAAATEDEFAAVLDRARIDELLEHRHALTSGRRTDAAEGSSPAGGPDKEAP